MGGMGRLGAAGQQGKSNHELTRIDTNLDRGGELGIIIQLLPMDVMFDIQFGGYYIIFAV